MSRVYGYAVVDKDGDYAPLNRKVYDTKNAAGAGFYQWSKRIYHPSSQYYHLKDKKIREQDIFKVIGLVSEPKPEILKLVFEDE